MAVARSGSDYRVCDSECALLSLKTGHGFFVVSCCKLLLAEQIMIMYYMNMYITLYHIKGILCFPYIQIYSLLDVVVVVVYHDFLISFCIISTARFCCN